MSVADILNRAKQRISAHGFDPTATGVRKAGNRKGFRGFSLHEAVYGLGRTSDATEEEIEALGLIKDAIASLYPEVAGEDLVAAFNATPGRRRTHVAAVLVRAHGLAEAAARRARPSNELEKSYEPLPELGPRADLNASDGLEGIVQTSQKAALALVSAPTHSDFFLSQTTKPVPSGDAS